MSWYTDDRRVRSAWRADKFTKARRNHSRILMCCILLVFLAGVLMGRHAHADIANGTPRFNWTDLAITPTAIRIRCDGATLVAALAGTIRTYQTTVGQMTVGPHSCYLVGTDAAGATETSNTVSFTIPKPKTVLTIQ